MSTPVNIDFLMSMAEVVCSGSREKHDLPLRSGAAVVCYEDGNIAAALLILRTAQLLAPHNDIKADTTAPCTT